MLVTPLYNGMGLGNQLANYVTTRCIALDNGYEWGIQFPENFKGASFMKLDMGRPVVGGKVLVEGQPPEELPKGIERYYREKTTLHPDGSNISDYDEYIKTIPDNTLIHGLLQGENYFKHRKDEIREWLKVTNSVETEKDVCVIAFRGGEYKYVPEFFLPKSYWDSAVEKMREFNPNVTFRVVTDDPGEASKFFNFPISHEIGHDYASILTAEYLIISNSSFAWFPAWLNQKVKKIIAPKFWGRRNKGYWSLPQNITEGFDYI